MTGRSLLARAARLCAILAAPLLALAAAPAAAQVTVSITSTPANGEYYVAGEAITTRIAGLAGNGVVSTTPNAFSASQMILDIGGVTVLATPTTILSSSRGFEELKIVDFSYTVAAADLDADGVSIPQNSIGGTGWRTGTGSTVLDRDHAALPAQSAHRVIGYTASISSTTPPALTEAVLNGATVAVALNGVTFGSGVTASSFELVTAMTGVSISGVSSVSSGDAAATLTLSSTADISDSADLAVRVRAAAHTGSMDLTTGAVRVAPVLAAGGASAAAFSVPVDEGSTGSWSVALNSNPGSGCTGAGSLTIGVTSDDTGAVTVSPATLTFNAANWSTPQTVTATGVQDGDLEDETSSLTAREC